MFGRTFRTVGILIVAIAVAAGLVGSGLSSCSTPDQRAVPRSMGY